MSFMLKILSLDEQDINLSETLINLCLESCHPFEELLLVQ